MHFGELGQFSNVQYSHNLDKCCKQWQICVIVDNIDKYVYLLTTLFVFIADSAETEYCPTFPYLCVCVCVKGMTSHISHIYKGINAMLIVRGPIKPYIFWIKIILAIFLAKTRPDKAIFSDLTNLTIDFDFELSKI